MSSLSSVSSATDPYQSTNLGAFVQFVNDFNAIGKSLQSGDLPGAQTALAAFQQDLPGGSQSQSRQPFGNNSQANTDFQSLTGALQSVDLAGAKKAYASLQTDLEGGGKSKRQPQGAVDLESTETASLPAEPDSLLDTLA